MNINGTVLNSSVEERELTGKDGTKRNAKISHVLLSVEFPSGVEIVNLRGYDVDWSLPKTGTKWASPRVKRYECFDGMVAEVSV